MKQNDDRRKQRTRRSIITAFNELVIEGEKLDIRVGDVIQRANVGRSTFYEHFANATDLHMQALAKPLTVLVDAIVGDAGPEALQELLEHFWENRGRARTTFRGRNGEHVSRLLAGLLKHRLSERIESPNALFHLATIQLAEAPLGLIRTWLYGETHCTARVLAQAICRNANASLAGQLESMNDRATE